MVAAQARIWSYIFSIGAPPPLPICLCGIHRENFETKTEVGVKHTPLSCNLVVTVLKQILPIVTKHKNQYWFY